MGILVLLSEKLQQGSPAGVRSLQAASALGWSISYLGMVGTS